MLVKKPSRPYSKRKIAKSCNVPPSREREGADSNVDLTTSEGEGSDNSIDVILDGSNHKTHHVLEMNPRADGQSSEKHL